MKTKLTLASAIKACDFNYVNENIVKLFKDEPIRGEIEVRNFGKYMTAPEVIAELEKDGCVPANATELYDWVSRNKDWGKDEYKYVVGLDSVASFEGRDRVPHVWWGASERDARLDWFDDEFGGGCWFAFSRESSPKTSNLLSSSVPLTLDLDSAIKIVKEAGYQISKLL